MPRKLVKNGGPKTGYGNGGVHEEKLGSGRWVAELDGVRRRAQSEAAANEKLYLLQERRDARLKIKQGSLTLDDWLAVWLERYCDHLKPKTLEGYRDVVRTYIQPYDLARVRLEALTADDIVQWLSVLRRKKIVKNGKTTDKKLSSGTIAIAFRRLRRALAVAKRHKLIGENPAADVEPPTAAPSREPVVLEPEQIIDFLAAWENHRFYALFAMLTTTGFRRGELLGIRWQDIDLDQGTITVRGQLQWLKVAPDQPRQPVWVATTKGRTGRRVVDISAELVEILRSWRHTQREERLILGSKWHGDDYVFTSEEGGPHSPRNLHRSFKRGLKRANLPLEMTLHDLRHCAGSLMLERGEDIEAVRELLGHSSRAVTERIYAHALKSRKRKAGESLGYLLRKNG